jgi:hypothetical protein
VLGLAAFCLVLDSAPAEAQTLVLHGGRIWTGEDEPREADAIVLDGDRILFVGGSDEALRRAGTARRIELRGRRVVPGFIDAHVHFLAGGDELLAPDLRSARSEEEFARRLGEAAARVPKGTWLTSGAWDHENWPGAHLPTRAVLDRFTPEHPVFVSRLDGHMAVANSLAIERARVRGQTPDPPGGTIVRDARGDPEGVFKDTAMALIARHVPAWDDRQRLARARAALRHAASLGVTGVHDMNEGYADLETFQALHRHGALTARITEHTPIGSHERWGAVRVQRGFGDQWLKVNGLKGFADGSLGSTTAWFFAPYDDAPGTSGLAMPALLAGGAMEEQVRSCTRLWLQVAIHAIGDRANRSVLEILERVGKDAELGEALRALRPRIEHCQHLHPNDVARFRQLGVVASMQPYHCIDDGRWAEKRIGAVRCATTYAFRSLLDAGTTLAFGSDWPVAPLSPMLGVYAAVTRRTLDDRNPDGWVPAQKITVAEALRAYTRGSAFAGHGEQEVGTLAAGKLADLVVLDRDPFTIPPPELRDVQVDLTIAGGRVVFEREGEAARRLRPAWTGRDAWGAELADERRLREHLVSRITVHHSGVRLAGWPQIDGAQKMRALQRFSRRDRPWGDVPYHFSIAPDGAIYEGRDVRYAGDTNTSYATAGHLLIEVIGDFEQDEPTPAQLASLTDLGAWACARWDLPLDRIGGHSDFAQTACPGKRLRAHLASGALRAAVEKRLTPGGNPRR